MARAEAFKKAMVIPDATHVAGPGVAGIKWGSGIGHRVGHSGTIVKISVTLCVTKLSVVEDCGKDAQKGGHFGESWCTFG